MIFEEANNTKFLLYGKITFQQDDVQCKCLFDVPWQNNIDVHWPLTDHFLTSWSIPETAGASQPVGSLLHLQRGTPEVETGPRVESPTLAVRIISHLFEM